MAKAQTEKKVAQAEIVLWVAVVVLQMKMVLTIGQVQVFKVGVAAARLLAMEVVQLMADQV
jgi:hypothetical protein